MKFRKKPIVVEAWHFAKGSKAPSWVIAAASFIEISLDGEVVGRIRLETLEGTMTAQPGDWIVRGVKGEVYSVQPDIFEATYEPVP